MSEMVNASTALPKSPMSLTRGDEVPSRPYTKVAPGGFVAPSSQIVLRQPMQCPLGAKAEILTTSNCCAVCPRKRTSDLLVNEYTPIHFDFVPNLRRTCAATATAKFWPRPLQNRQ
jgi:hypothetical protein